MKRGLSVLILLLFCISFVFATPGDWKGLVDINGSEPAVGTTVSVYTGSTLLDSTTTPTTAAGATALDSNGFYILVFEALEGAALTFKVCGITADTNTFSVGTHDLNISATLQANGTAACTCDGICTGGYCVNPGTSGVCSSNTYYCNSNGSCETAYGETSSNCSADCSTGGGSPGGGSGSGGADEEVEEEETEEEAEPVEVTETVETFVSEVVVEPAQVFEILQDSTLTAEEVEEYIAAAETGALKVKRNLEVKKTTSASGEESYLSTFKIVVTNESEGNLKDVTLVETIPKNIAQDASEITSISKFKVLVKDPVLEFTVPILNSGETTSIYYSVNKKVTEADFKDVSGTVSKGTVVEKSSDLNVEDGETTGTDETTTEKSSSVWGWIIGIVVVLVVVIIVFFSTRKQPKHRR